MKKQNLSAMVIIIVFTFFLILPSTIGCSFIGKKLNANIERQITKMNEDIEEMKINQDKMLKRTVVLEDQIKEQQEIINKLIMTISKCEKYGDKYEKLNEIQRESQSQEEILELKRLGEEAFFILIRLALKEVGIPDNIIEETIESLKRSEKFKKMQEQ